MAMMGLETSDISDYVLRCQREPVWWIKTHLGDTLWSMQQEIANCIRDNTYTTVKACHAPGKTHLVADLCLWFLFSHPDSIVLTTAPTYRQVEHLLWRRMRRLYNDAPVNLGGKFLKQPRLDIGEEWFALGLSPKESDRMNGFHAPYMLIIVDEASGVPEEIFHAIRGIMASGKIVRLVLLGNPDKPAGQFYSSFDSARWKKFTISAFHTPNFLEIGGEFAYKNCTSIEEKLKLLRSVPDHKLPYPYLTKPSWAADLIEEFGEDSPIVQAKVFANFPKDSPNLMFPLWRCMEAVNRWHEAPHWWKVGSDELLDVFGDQLIELGVDVARYGDNESVFSPRLGDVAAPQIIRTGQDTTANYNTLRTIIRDYCVDITRIDGIGTGAGLVDRCNEDELQGIIDLNVGKGALGPTKEDTKKARLIFANLRAQIFWGLRQRFEQGRIAIPPDMKLVGQLSSMWYKQEKGKVSVCSKDDLKVSPDRADGLAYAYADVYPEYIPPLIGVAGRK